MKQIRMIALMGLTLMMGVLMTSCLGSNDDDNKTTQDVVAVYENSVLQDLSGVVLEPTNPSYLPATNGVYNISIEYDPTTISGNKLSVTILEKPVNLTNNNLIKGEGVGNINLYAIEYNSGYTNLRPEMCNQDYILVPCIYWMDDVSAEEFPTELAKHHFGLFYPEDLTSADGILNLTLIDMVDDPTLNRYKYYYDYQAFNIKKVIADFKAKNGDINKIRVWASVNRNSYDPTEQTTSKEYAEVDLTVFK